MCSAICDWSDFGGAEGFTENPSSAGFFVAVTELHTDP